MALLMFLYWQATTELLVIIHLARWTMMECIAYCYGNHVEVMRENKVLMTIVQTRSMFTDSNSYKIVHIIQPYHCNV
jgi:hypothetical protein